MNLIEKNLNFFKFCKVIVIMLLPAHLEAEIVETTLVVSQFHFLRVGSRISELRVIISRIRDS